MILRDRQARDDEAIAALVAQAFVGTSWGHNGEAAIAPAVRAEGRVVVERVAEIDDALVGHVLFSRMACDNDAFIVGLAPVSVSPAHQCAGIGGALCRDGLDLCRDLGAVAAVVLGDPAYYGRFGFSREAALALEGPYAALPAFMAVELVAGGLRGVRAVAYPAAFD